MSNPLNKFKVKKVQARIFGVECKSTWLLAQMFCRFQEHYESPRFRGKIFSMEEFEKWYANSRPDGKFSYFSDWAGFNIPSYVLKPFYEAKFDKLSTKEKWLLTKFKSEYQSGQPFYIIGYVGVDAATKKHEIAHGYYFTDVAYRAGVEATLSCANLSSLKKLIKKMGYGNNVLLDECHAYILTEKRYLKRKRVWLKSYDTLQRKLNRLYKKAMERK